MFIPTLRLVISLVNSISVLIVAITVISIAGTLYPQITTELGLKYAISLGTTGANEIESFFDRQYNVAQSAGISISSLPDFKLPIDDATFNGDQLCSLFQSVLLISNFSLQSLGMIMDDGSSAGAQSVVLDNGTRLTRCTTISVFNAAVTGQGTLWDKSYDSYTKQELNDSALFPPSLAAGSIPTDTRPSAYAQVKQIVLLDRETSVWTPAVAYKRDVVTPTVFAYPLTSPCFNSTGTFLGFIAIIVSLEDLGSLLSNLQSNHPNSHALCIDGSEIILASTIDNNTAPIAKIYDQPAAEIVPTGCLQSNDNIYLPVNGIVCPIKPSDYNYAPLRSFVRSRPNYFRNPTDFSETAEYDNDDSSDGDYVVVGNKINNAGRLFKMSVIFFFYFGEIDRSIMVSRNVTIGVGVAVLIFAVVVSILSVIVILRPLEDVAKKMMLTSKLKLHTSDQEMKRSNLSSISEIFSIQLSYLQFHTSVDAFVKYVPRDVVRSLLASAAAARKLKNNNNNNNNNIDIVTNADSANNSNGNNNNNMAKTYNSYHQMSSTSATILCADMANFTRICERHASSLEAPLPPSAAFEGEDGDENNNNNNNNNNSFLAQALQSYFEQMSSIIANHDGVIIQFQGDAILASFGTKDFPCEYPQVKACLAALMMTRETCLQTLTNAFSGNLGETLSIRVGITSSSSGGVLCGILGSKERIAYSVFGPTVDLASTLEASNKKYGTRIMVSEGVEENVRSFFLLRALGYVDPSLNEKYEVNPNHNNISDDNNNLMMNNNNSEDGLLLGPHPQRQTSSILLQNNNAAGAASSTSNSSRHQQIFHSPASPRSDNNASSPPATPELNLHVPSSDNNNTTHNVYTSDDPHHPGSSSNPASLSTKTATEQVTTTTASSSSSKHNIKNNQNNNNNSNDHHPEEQDCSTNTNDSNDNNNNNNYNNNNDNNTMMMNDDHNRIARGPMEFDYRSSKIFELVGLLPLRVVDLSQLKESKNNKNRVMVMMNMNNNSNSNNNNNNNTSSGSDADNHSSSPNVRSSGTDESGQDRNDDNDDLVGRQQHQKRKHRVERYTGLGAVSSSSDTDDTNNKNDKSSASSSHRSTTPTNRGGGDNNNNFNNSSNSSSNNSLGSSFNGSSTSSGSFYRRYSASDIASTFSSALKKKSGNNNNNKKRRHHRKIRLTCAAMFETAARATVDEHSLVASEMEIEFVQSFNLAVAENFSRAMLIETRRKFPSFFFASGISAAKEKNALFRQMGSGASTRCEAALMVRSDITAAYVFSKGEVNLLSPQQLSNNSNTYNLQQHKQGQGEDSSSSGKKKAASPPEENNLLFFQNLSCHDE